MRSVPPCGSGWVLLAVPYDADARQESPCWQVLSRCQWSVEPTRYREVVLTSWDRGMCVPRPTRYREVVLTCSIGHLNLGHHGLTSENVGTVVNVK